jgi:hypothetical protein
VHFTSNNNNNNQTSCRRLRADSESLRRPISISLTASYMHGRFGQRTPTFLPSWFSESKNPHARGPVRSLARFDTHRLTRQFNSLALVHTWRPVLLLFDPKHSKQQARFDRESPPKRTWQCKHPLKNMQVAASCRSPAWWPPPKVPMMPMRILHNPNQSRSRVYIKGFPGRKENPVRSTCPRSIPALFRCGNQRAGLYWQIIYSTYTLGLHRALGTKPTSGD